MWAAKVNSTLVDSNGSFNVTIDFASDNPNDQPVQKIFTSATVPVLSWIADQVQSQLTILDSFSNFASVPELQPGVTIGDSNKAEAAAPQPAAISAAIDTAISAQIIPGKVVPPAGP